MLPSRSRCYGVGKEIGGAVYIHCHYESALGDVAQQAKQHLPSDFTYTVIKYNAKRGTVSFIYSSDFDTAPEPTVGDIWVVYPSGATRRIPQPVDPFVYHHKWLFVNDDYLGFSVEDSIRRSLSWMSLEKVDRSRIGKQSYWCSQVIPLIPSLPLESAASCTSKEHK